MPGTFIKKTKHNIIIDSSRSIGKFDCILAIIGAQVK